MLDGLSDTGRFVSLYGHLGARLFVVRLGWGGVGAGVRALVAHSIRPQPLISFARRTYLRRGQGE